MRTRKLASLIALSLLLSGPVLAQENVDKVFGGITAEAGKEYGSLETVNGGITVREGAQVRQAETVNGGIHIHNRARLGSAETVNGGIELGDVASARSLETVNGGIDLGAGSLVEQNVETVNGGIRGEKGARVRGDASTVNGKLDFTGGEIGGDLVTTNGDILLESTTVAGGIRVEKPNSTWFNSGKQRKPRIVVGPGSVVQGSLVFEREVELFVHASAKIGPVTGATAQSYTDRLPARD
ncbi:hypothetical protein [Arenimonas sp. MALMAid1274]|uniref:hypothetical protein n=1 Tax=Arenimonas sp. MALMAid1274 TaxID=3411630 RepID=UPI003BA24496